jgi:ABC-2 type transport system permease protein
MKTAIKIARLELSTLFYSPIAWFLLIVFFFQCGFSYTDKIGDYVTMQGTGVPREFLTYLTDKIYGYPYGMFPNIIGKLFLYIPLLTMGLISRELNSGTIKLLYSSPIRISQIVIGKFLAMMMYNLLLILVLTTFVVVSCFNITHVDYGQLLSALLGIYLMLCAFTAIGLFMSCLTSYQVVAALSTFVLFAFLTYVGSIGQEIDFVRDITYALSISGRTSHMVSGLISTKDVLYFWVIIYLFLGLSILKLKTERESKPKWLIYGRYGALLLSGILVSFLSSRPGLIAYYDMTAAKTQTLTVSTQKILKETGDAPLEVTSYINLLDQRYFYGAPDKRSNDADRWEPYLRFKHNIKFRYIYYYDSVPEPEIYKGYPGKSLKQIADSYANLYKVDFGLFKSPEEVRRMVNLAPEQNRYVMQLTLKGRSTFLRLFNDNATFPGESEISAALKRMTVQLPKIAFLEGNQERSIDQFGNRSYKPFTNDITFRYALINQGFDMESVSLKNNDLPAGVSALVIADPQTPFEPAELERIKEYIAGGGNLLIAGEPGGQSILDPIIGPMGVRLMDGTIVQPSKEHSTDLVLTRITPFGAALSKLVRNDYEDSLPVALSGATGLSFADSNGFHIEQLLTTDPAKGGEKVPTALALSRTIRGHEQRIIITGDADFLSILNMRREHIETANYHFNAALFGWFTYGRFPIDTTRPRPGDDHMDISMPGVTVLKYVFMGVIPAILLILCAFILLRRKKQ